jgi:hypothetical protein
VGEREDREPFAFYSKKTFFFQTATVTECLHKKEENLDRQPQQNVRALLNLRQRPRRKLNR